MKKSAFVFVIFVIVLLSTSFVSAGWFDWIKDMMGFGNRTRENINAMAIEGNYANNMNNYILYIIGLIIIGVVLYIIYKKIKKLKSP